MITGMDAITFKAQLAPIQSAIMAGPDGLQVKMMPVEMDGQLAAHLFDLQQTAFTMTVLDSMGNISFNASFPDTKSAIAINKTTPQFQIRIPKGDLLTGLRLVALFGIVFQVEIETNGKPKEKAKKERKPKEPKGEYGQYWHEMFGKYFYDNPDLKQVLALDISASQLDVKEALRRIFNVSSLSFVSPEQLEEFANGHDLVGLVSQSRQAAVVAAEMKQ
jgi:hypothetical protein